MKRMNNKGYMLVEIIMVFVITFGILYYMMDLVIRLKNKNDDLFVETLVKTDTSIVINKLMEYAMAEVDSNESALKFCDNIKIEGQVIKYGDQVVNIVDDIASIISLDEFCKVDKKDGKVSIRIPVNVKQSNGENYDIIMDYKYMSSLKCNPVESFRCKNPDGSWNIVGDEPYSIDYNGNCSIHDDGDGNWRVKFLSDGELKVGCDMEIDVFLVGGGGNGGVVNWGCGSGGGGGGYTKTEKNVSIVNSENYRIDIGAAASDTTAFGFVAKHGNNGGNPTQNSNYTINGGNGGDGGSGGGAGSLSGYTMPGGGINGGNGGTINSHEGRGGKGQCSGVEDVKCNTKEFGEPDGQLYASGGSGGGTGASGYCGGSFILPRDGAPNTGDGGHGGCGGHNSSNLDYRNVVGIGGSGIVVIRNKR